MQHLLNLTHDDLKAWFAERGLKAFHAGQVRRWLFGKRAGGFDEMTELGRPLRSRLAEYFRIWATTVAAVEAADDGSEKLLLELDDGHRVECVLLSDDRGHRTACISTQVGCAMGCAFCASGLGGLARNLTAGEIVEQLLRLQRHLPGDERLSRVVVMGVGEPLSNLDRLLAALDSATAADALGISARRVTISTVGLPEGIRRLAEADCRYHLAVSLHAPDDDLRNRLVPANRKIGIAAILAAADDYFAATGRRVTYEYVLLGSVNDRPLDARRLVDLLKGRTALINLIPYNLVAELPFQTPAAETSARFAEILQQGGLTVKIRHRKGNRIGAACGQLRRSHA